MGHVGDRHIQRPVATLVFAGIHRVVEVFRILTVDRDEWDIAHVFAARKVGLANLVGEAAGLFLYCIRPLVRDVVATQRDVDLEPRCTAVAQYFGDTSDRLASPRRVFHDFGDDELAVFGIAGILVGDKDLMRDALAVWHYDAEALLVVIAADYLRKPALQNLDDSAFFTAAVVYARHASEHLVAVEQCLHLTCAKEQVLRAVFRNEEAEAVFIALDTPFDKLHARRQAIHATSITNQLPITAHRDQPAPKRLDLLVADKAQSPAQGLVI